MTVTFWKRLHLTWLKSHSETRCRVVAAFLWIVSIKRDWDFEMSILFYTIGYQVLFCLVKWRRLGVFLLGDCSNTLIRICLFHWSHPLQYHQCSLFASLRCSSILKSDLVKMIENVHVESRLIFNEFYLSIFRMNVFVMFSKNLLSLKSKDKTKTNSQLEFSKNRKLIN